MKAYALTISLCMAGLVGGCVTTPKTPEDVKKAVLGSWTLQKASKLPEIPTNILLTFHPDTVKGDTKVNISGFSGVNHFTSSANVNWGEQRLVIAKIDSTRRMGPEPRMQFEQAFLNQLKEVVTFKLQWNGKLTLTTTPGETMTFVQGMQ